MVLFIQVGRYERIEAASLCSVNTFLNEYLLPTNSDTICVRVPLKYQQD